MWRTIDIVPSSIANDPQVIAGCEAIDQELRDIYGSSGDVVTDDLTGEPVFDDVTGEPVIDDISQANGIPSILFWPFVDRQIPPLLDVLAWEMHVDIWAGWDGALTVEQKRMLIEESIEWHQYKGTKWAVERMLKTVFQTGYVLEWYQYGGNPYYFKIIVEELIADSERLLRVIQGIYAVKNIRSWLESFEKLKKTTAQMFVSVLVTTNLKNYFIPVSTNTPLSLPGVSPSAIVTDDLTFLPVTDDLTGEPVIDEEEP